MALIGGILVFVGTYTGNGSEGIYIYRFDPATGALQQVGTVSGDVNPSFLAISPDRRFLYAVNETHETGGTAGGAVSAYSLDSATGALGFINRQPSGGKHPCHVSVTADGRFVYVANYSSGTVSCYAVGGDGALGAPLTVAHEGSGPNAGRQEGPHAHSVTPDPVTGLALAADLGIDRVVLYRTSLAEGRPVVSEAGRIPVRGGSGPRHVAFSRDGRFLYVVNELDSTVSAFRRGDGDASFEPIAQVGTLPGGYEGSNSCADIHVGASGRFLYASNRGHDSIAVFRLHPETGVPSAVGHVATGGKTPRNFALDPSGAYLLAANQGSGTITIFQIDPETGMPVATGESVAVPAPVCVRFFPAK